jgi:hypothetical protein
MKILGVNLKLLKLQCIHRKTYKDRQCFFFFHFFGRNYIYYFLRIKTCLRLLNSFCFMFITLFPTLGHLLKTYEYKIMSDVFWMLTFVSDSFDQISQSIVNGNFVPLLLKILE